MTEIRTHGRAGEAGRDGPPLALRPPLRHKRFVSHASATATDKTTDTENRLQELELKFTEQAELLQQLSEVLYAQERTIELMGLEVKVLKKKLEGEPGLVDAQQNERPPHY